MEKYLSNYIGVVIQNNDPEMRGRIKVFIPNISTNLYENWNKDINDKIFNFVDNPELNKILNQLKEILPWAEYAGPIFGGCASGRYNASLKKGVVSDTNSFSSDNKTIDGYRPLNIYTNELAYPDAFSATGKVGNNLVNPYAYQYIPSNYSNLAKGMFSIPNVGSHVWVWFINGDSNYPVYFASAYGGEDIKRIYTMSQKLNLEGDDATSLDYPASYENDDNPSINSDSKTFRSKHVINSNKNSIELIDTDGREGIKFTHYSGSMLEMNNETTIKFSSSNDQTMVLGDTFNTLWKNKSEFIGGVSDQIIKGDSLEKIGFMNYSSIDKIFDIYKNIHNYKSLFDVKRTSATTTTKSAFSENVTSQFQTQDGGYNVCPVCKARPYIQKIWEMSPIHKRLCLYIPLPFPGFQGIDIMVPGLPPFLNTNGRVGYIAGRTCQLCNLTPTNYTYSPDHTPGLSPSTENGYWNIETKKQINGELGDLYRSVNSEILDLQNNLGEGGDKITNIARNYVLSVGLAMNDLLSYRVDARGKLKSTRLYVAPESTLLIPKPSPHVEHVDVDDLPGGDLIITAGNKLKFLVGSNGINIKTFGPIEMYGSIVNLTSEQMNIISKHDLFVDGGEKLSLRGRNISLNPFEHNPVLVEGGLHVSRNVIVQGGAYVEGELGVQHITAPEQWYKTQPSGCMTMLVNTLFQLPPGIGSFPALPHIHPVIIELPDHQHYYKNIPINLTKCKEQARDAMAQLGINANFPSPALAIQPPELGIAGLTDAQSAISEAGVDTNTVTSIFDSINSAINTSPINDVLNGIEQSVNNLGDSVNQTYNNINSFIDSNLNTLNEAFENSLSESI